MSADDELTLIERLEILERRHNRLRKEAWLWRLGFVAAVGAVTYLIILQTGAHSLPIPKAVNCDTIHARTIVVDDDKGQMRILLCTTDDGIAGQSFWSPDGKLLTVIGANNKGGVATFNDYSGKANVWTGFYSDGRPGIHIRDGQVLRAQLDLQLTGAHLVLRDEAGNVTFTKP